MAAKAGIDGAVRAGDRKPMRRFDAPRWRSAAVGFLLTLALPAAVAASQFTFASWIVEASWNVDPRADESAVHAFKSALITFHLSLSLILSCYWTFVAIFGRGNVLHVRSADVVLVTSGLIYAAGMLLVSISYNPATWLMPLCPLLGVSDKTMEFGFDALTPCEALTGKIYGRAFFDLPLILLGASAVLRVLASRGRTRL